MLSDESLEEMLLAISDSVLLIAGGAFASAYVLVSTSSGDFLTRSILALGLAAFLAAFSFVLRVHTPQERVKLHEDSIEEIVTLIDAPSSDMTRE